MGITDLAQLPDLKPQRELDTTFSVRLSAEDRERLGRAASELGVSPGRLLRAIARRALSAGETIPESERRPGKAANAKKGASDAADVPPQT